MGSTTPTTPPLPYWHTNVPSPLRTARCPAFLLRLSPKDLGIISTPDSLHRPLSWPGVRAIIRENRLDAFQRKPSDLRRYLEYNWNLKREYGSVMTFVAEERLGWDCEGMQGKGGFEREENLKVLWNDWPYGIDERIVHLVVWTKFELEDDPKTGDLTDKARSEIQDYVDKTFSSKVGKENVVWFKNWSSLKSVHAVEHFHVMLFDPQPEFIKEITNGDVPLSRRCK
ncbi:hypothetical protein B0O99DRAFT_647818 [Bisporella sp. PMI_857]|nr:hypothetical protein B0O99DRAFT_647818 [Bisporella sp. PMI_857]